MPLLKRDIIDWRGLNSFKCIYLVKNWLEVSIWEAEERSVTYVSFLSICSFYLVRIVSDKLSLSASNDDFIFLASESSLYM